jgi:Mg2+-importing ATPase
MPSKFLMAASLIIVAVGVLIPLSPLAGPFGFVIPPAAYFLVLAAIVAVYLFLVQAVKVWFIRKFGYE